jgi:hypothetical protein
VSDDRDFTAQLLDGANALRVRWLDAQELQRCPRCGVLLWYDTGKQRWYCPTLGCREKRDG